MPTWTLELRSPDRDGDVHPVLTTTLVATDVDAVRKQAKQLLARKGYPRVRAISFTTSGKIVAYLPGPNYRDHRPRRELEPGVQGATVVTEGGTVSTVTPVQEEIKVETTWRRPPGPRRGRETP